MRFFKENLVLFCFLSFLIVKSQNITSVIDSLGLNKLKVKTALKVINKELAKNHNANVKAALFEYKSSLLKNDFDIFNALDLIKKSYNLYKKSNNIEAQLRLLNKLSEIYIELEDYSSAITKLSLVKELLSETDKTSNSGRYQANMARLYFKTGEYQKAKQHYYRSFVQAQKNKNTFLLHKNFLDFASVFIETKELDSAMHYIEKVLTFSAKVKNHQLLAKGYLLKGAVYEKESEFILAENQFNKAIKTLAIKGSNSAYLYKKFGNFYTRVFLFDEANKYLKIAAKKSLGRNDLGKLQKIYHDLVENSLLQKKPRQANYYFKKLDSLNRITTKLNQQRNVEYINERYNIQQAEIKYINDRNNLLKKQAELINEKKISKKNKQISIIVGILFLFFTLFAYFYYRYNKLKTEKTHLRLKNTVLRLQMNPHFIFNSLTAIQNSVLKNDQLKSAELIATFSRLMRMNLEYSNRKEINLSDEIEMLTSYLEVQKFRFDNLFDYDLIIDFDIDQTKIPPMLLQPFIENSIEHGLKHKEGKGLITIKIEKIKNGISICIRDNGVGVDSAKLLNKNHDDKNKIHAIKIFKERLKVRDKKEESFFIMEDIINEDKEIVGTQIKFNLID